MGPAKTAMFILDELQGFTSQVGEFFYWIFVLAELSEISGFFQWLE